MKNSPASAVVLPRIIGLIGIAICAILAIGVAEIDWFSATMLAFLASLILLAKTQSLPKG